MLGCKHIVVFSILTLLLLNALSATAYASNGIVTVSTFDVSVGNKTYPVEYSMNNGGSITNAEVDIPNLSLFLTVESPTDGHLELAFSRQTYDALSFTEHGGPLLFVDEGVEVHISEFSQSCEQTSFLIPVSAGTEKLELIYPDILMEHTHSYPQVVDIVETITIKDLDFSVRLMTDSTKCDISFVKGEKKIHIDIQGRNEADMEQGYFRATIPHDLLGGNYTVLVDGEPVDFLEQSFFVKNYTDNAEFAFRDDFSPYGASHLVFNYPIDAKSIDIVGTSAAPEFGSIALLLMTAGIVASIIVGRRLRQGNTTAKLQA